VISLTNKRGIVGFVAIFLFWDGLLASGGYDSKERGV